MNILEKLNGDSFLPYWGTPECNSIEASDGTIFPPAMLDRNTTLHIFYANLCRRLPFQYKKDVEMGDGVQLLRYGMPEDVFDDPARNPANQCYCEIDSGTCPPRGIINVTSCAMDPKLREPFIGLDPRPDLHESYLDIHPTLGISLNAYN
ncbi:unnamed protein product [Leptidea sinapis]|uniref:Scavenger receptor class B member 1 n=1 Tax=Leptidea sinapis TaxID=189913 RepID=A0A5E4QPU8_9NEOP|nr:unnamed protein product [Leptidea sinapis]